MLISPTVPFCATLHVSIRRGGAKSVLGGGIPPECGQLYTAINGIAQTQDLNGNQTNDGTRSITWDAKNQLTSVTKLATNSVIGQYRYDACGRGIWRQYVDPADNQTKTIRYVYDGWNVTTEHNATGVLQRRNIWGKDLSGSFQGVGGVGGLLLVEDRTNPANTISYYSCYDGNGNITEVLTQNTAGAVTVAQNRYYDAFGNIWGGTVANGGGIHRWRFSTKLQDEETGWSYYGFRSYDPVKGRWLSRDPIGERGGINLYGMVRNNAVGKVDILGRMPSRGSVMRETGFQQAGNTDFLNESHCKCFNSVNHAINSSETIAGLYQHARNNPETGTATEADDDFMGQVNAEANRRGGQARVAGETNPLTGQQKIHEKEGSVCDIIDNEASRVNETANSRWSDRTRARFPSQQEFEDYVKNDKDNYLDDEINSSRQEQDFLNRFLARLRVICRCISTD